MSETGGRVLDAIASDRVSLSLCLLFDPLGFVSSASSAPKKMMTTFRPDDSISLSHSLILTLLLFLILEPF